ncbi:MAG: PA14 domain-containing protein, partial [Thermoplasmatota archaeon]
MIVEGLVHSRRGAIIVISLLLLLLPPSTLISFSEGYDPGVLSDSRTPKWEGVTYDSLDGEHDVEDIFFSRIVGDDTTSPQGKLGEFTGHADVNGDGTDDLVISAPRLYSPEGEQHAGVCYIFYGNDTLRRGSIDLKADQANITIKATSPGSLMISDISAGDLDDDGYTDIALGMVVQGDTGKVYILWGGPEGWDREIILYKAGNAEPNGNPVGFLRRNDFAIISGYVTTSAEGTKLGKNVIIGDVDQDGMDDLIFSYHGWNKLFFVWGGYPRTGFGTEYTYFNMDPQNIGIQGGFGSTVALCDLNGDNRKDLVVGAPHLEDETKGIPEVGAVFVYYNISFVRGNISLTPDVGLRPLIMGSDAYDNFGSTLLVKDINGDLRDDIIVGVPYADGINDASPNVGQIMIFLGGEISKFPDEMYSEQLFGTMIIGERPAKGDFTGDKIGGSFDIGDIDGDSRMELVIGLPGRERGSFNNVGAVVGYDNNMALPDLGGIVDLSTATKKFFLLGMEQEDVLGYAVSIADLNNDGSDDLFAGAPSADGVDNLRPGCGEVFVFPGNSMSVTRANISGPAMVRGKVLPASGYFNINVTYRHSLGPGSVDKVEVVLEPGLIDARLTFHGGEFLYEGPFVIDLDEDNSSESKAGSTGRVSFRISIDWYSRLGREWDILVSLTDSSDIVVERYFSGLLPVNNDVIVQDDYQIFSGGKKINPSDWQRPGSEIEITGIQVNFKDSLGRAVPVGYFDIVLFRNDVRIATIPYTGPGDSIMETLPSDDTIDYTLKCEFNAASPMEDWPGEPPDVSGMIEFQIRTDANGPKKPSNLRLEPDVGRISIYDDDPLWKARWDWEIGPGEDINSSGIKNYVYRVDDSPWTEVRTKGGLWGTYYNGSDFQDIRYGQLDPVIDFDAGDWGPWGPDVDELTPAKFSVRWHGWFRADRSQPYQFSIGGNGNGMLVLGNEVLIDWSDLTLASTSPQRYITEGTYLPIEVYYFNDDPPSPPPSSSFYLRYINEIGNLVPVTSELLHYPGNTTSFELGDIETFDFSVASVDWVKTSSAPITRTGYIDRDAPVIDMTGLSSWYGSEQPVLDLVMRDPDIDGYPGSGIDISSLQYRIMERSSDGFSEWIDHTGEVETITKGVEGDTQVSFSLELSLRPDWRGSIQFRGSDDVGNSVESAILDMGIDVRAPIFEFLSPNLVSTQKEGNIDLVIKAVDRPGSGVDPSTVEWRYGMDGVMSEWLKVNASGGGEEMIFGQRHYFYPGVNEIQFRARDNVGNGRESEMFKMTVEKRIENLPPVPGIRSPLNDTVIHLGTPLSLDGSDTTDDGQGAFEELRFTWISNIDGYLGSGEIINVYLGSLGEHRIRLYVDDGTPGHNISAEVNVIVKEKDDQNNTEYDPPATEERNYWMPILFG